MMGVALLFSVALLGFGPDDKPAQVDPTLLVGVWEQVKDAGEVPAGSTTEFTANGQYHFRPKANNISEYHSTYRLQGDRIFIESMNPGLVSGTEVGIVELTPTKLILNLGGEEREHRRKGSGRGTGPMTGQRTTTFNLGGPARGANAGRWTPILADEDGYVVEMPGPPNSESEEGGMGFSIRIKSHRAANAEYAVLTNKAPIPFPKDQLGPACRQVCTKSAERFGSNVQITVEKPIRLGSTEGREYEMTIDRPDCGVGTALCRVYPLEKSAYALLVLRTRPEPFPAKDARQFFDSFALSREAPADRTRAEAPAPRARTAPNPSRRGTGAPAAGRESPVVWGNEVDPDGDVQIRKNGPALSFAIPPTPHLLAPERGVMNAPRVVMPVGGDFAVSVRVDGKFDPSDKSTTKGLSSREAGGLIVWKDAKNYLVFQRRASAGGDEGKDRNQVVLEELVGGEKGATQRQAAAPGSLYLRLDREGSRIKPEFSTDGRRWVEIKPVNASWAEGGLEVGVVAVSNSTTAHQVTFDSYSLRPR